MFWVAFGYTIPPGVTNSLNENRLSARFLIGLVAVVLLLLVGLSTWYLRPPTEASVDRDAEPSDRRPEEPKLATDPDLPDNSGAVRSRGSDPSDEETSPVFAFAQYDRKPAGYAGTAQCAGCHEDEHRSYLLTHHSQSLREVDPLGEGRGQTLAHPPSKESYDVLADRGILWHRQWRHFSDAPGDRMKLSEFPVCYVMGSGAFGKGYLLGDGDYLLQSPVTWYAGNDDLGMAPGYDRVFHVGMTRVITAECMYCHAGLLTQRNENPYHLAIHELSIGCERCHGPGEAHVQLYRELESGELEAPADEIDPQIVHPGKLDRRRLESICGQCHLHGDIVVYPPGGQVWDFVPGEDFAETRLHYKHDKPGDFKDSFTGHFDQMWQSECYLQSETLTCVTCHNPHRQEPVVDQVEWRRQQCNACHEADRHCGLPLDQRLERAENNCIECHMPSIESDVPHTSTTSHLIAVYESGKPRGIEPAATESIRRVEVSLLVSDQLSQRAEAIAEAAWAVQRAREGEYDWLDAPSLDDGLLKVLEVNPDDAYAHSMLSRVYRLKADRLAATGTPSDDIRLAELWDKVARHAKTALPLEKRPVGAREVALQALAHQQIHAEDYAAAARSLAELVQMRRSAVDWYNLGLCYGKLRRSSDAEKAFRQAIRLDGTYVAPYRSLSILYRRVNPAASRQLAEISQRLMLQP